jgi:folate-dependent phosphoribosylglycinamide formyltransferase PurN
MIGLDIGLWSGFKRKMEIAESFAQPIIIVSTHPSILPVYFGIDVHVTRCYVELVHSLRQIRYRRILDSKTPKLY